MKLTSEQLLDLFGLKVGDRIFVDFYNLYFIIEKHEKGYYSLVDDYGMYRSLNSLIDLQYEIIKPKPILTEDENDILRNIGINFKWIARDNNNMLYWFHSKPRRIQSTDDWWGVEENEAGTIMFDEMFKFITKDDEEPYNIKELLDETQT